MKEKAKRGPKEAPGRTARCPARAWLAALLHSPLAERWSSSGPPPRKVLREAMITVLEDLLKEEDPEEYQIVREVVLAVIAPHRDEAVHNLARMKAAQAREAAGEGDRDDAT